MLLSGRLLTFFSATGDDLNQDEWQQEAKRREQLHPELAEYLEETSIGLRLNHPLVSHWGVDPERAAIENRWHRETLKRVHEAHEKRDWSSFVFLHTRPYRLDAFIEIVNELPNRDFWSILSNVWTDSENIWQHQDDWCMLWNEGRSYKRFAMNPEERKAFKRLPNELVIYRGADEEDAADGMSWTLDRDKAIWFARRRLHLKHRPVLVKAYARKSDAHALLLGRNENEVVIDQFEIVATEYAT